MKTRRYKSEHRWVVGTEPHHAEASLVGEGQDWYELTDVWCHRNVRRQGWATEAVRAALAFADAQGRQVVLRIFAHDGDHGPNAVELRRFYSKFGFGDFPEPSPKYDMIRSVPTGASSEAATTSASSF